MASSLKNQEKVVIRVPQADFVDIIRQESDSIQFAIRSIDDDGVLQVTVAPAQKDYYENQVGFKFVDKVSKITADEQSELVANVFKQLEESVHSVQIVFLIDEDNQILAYRRHNSTDPPTLTKVLMHPTKDLLYSRSKGILETGLLERKKVAVIGLGSGGSHIAVELAKAGVGRFLLIDFDRIELSNIIRHTCGISDLGRFKTKAVRDCILEKNPFAEVQTHELNINDDLPAAASVIKDCDLIIGATDNNDSRRNINSIAFEYKIPAIIGKCRKRADGGDVTVVRPGEGPCFLCTCGNNSNDDDEEEISSFRQAREANPAYVSDAKVESTIQVGLSSDIQPIGNLVVKIALVELCKGTTTPLTSLEEDFKHPYYVWANRLNVPLEENYLKYDLHSLHMEKTTTILRWYADCRDDRDDRCKICNPTNTHEEEKQLTDKN